jgi:prepilin-type N-terminal cleavage/methylation domain-containing protein
MKNKANGFTLLEVAIAISIFGILMLSFSQLMRSEIRLYASASQKNEVETIARTAMMRVLDEIRINPYTIYSPDTGGYNSGVYQDIPNAAKTILINTHPSPGILASLQSNPADLSPGIYYDWEEGKLWFCDGTKINLIADQIYGFAITPVSTDTKHLVRIFIGVGDPNGEYYDLITWARLY